MLISLSKTQSYPKEHRKLTALDNNPPRVNCNKVFLCSSGFNVCKEFKSWNNRQEFSGLPVSSSRFWNRSNKISFILFPPACLTLLHQHCFYICFNFFKLFVCFFFFKLLKTCVKKSHRILITIIMKYIFRHN